MLSAKSELQLAPGLIDFVSIDNSCRRKTPSESASGITKANFTR